MIRQHMLGLLLLSVFSLAIAASAQDRNCPHFSGAVKRRLQRQARWIVNEAFQKAVAQESSAFGRLIAFEQCHVLESRLLVEDDTVEGPYFVVDGVPLKSLIRRHGENWMMAVAPVEANSKMPAANLLEITQHKWTLLYRDDKGNRHILRSASY